MAMRRASELLSSEVKEVEKEWVHVGDCIENDVRAAKRVGMRTVFYQPPEGKQVSLHILPCERCMRHCTRRENAPCF